MHITINGYGSSFNYFGAGGPPATCKKAGGKTGGAYFTLHFLRPEIGALFSSPWLRTQLLPYWIGFEHGVG